MDKRRTGMVLLLFLFWPCVWGGSGKTQNGMSHYKADEGQDLVLKWSCPQLLDLSALDVDCRFISNNNNLKMLRMDQGGESDWDEQFSGRVQCDREALKQGKVKIVFTRLTGLDSGEYKCDMHAAKSGSWKFENHEHFEIHVLPSKTTTAATTPLVQSTPVTAVTKQPETNDKSNMILIALGISIPLACLSLIGLFYRLCGVCKQNSELDEDQPSTEPPPDNGAQTELPF